MSLGSDRIEVNPPRVVLLEDTDSENPIAKVSKEKQKQLLDYLTSRLELGNQDRGTRIKRFGKIDQAISTWQKLGDTDAERTEREQQTGVMEAISFNLPLMATHLDDTVAFFAEIFAPTGRNFYSTGSREEIEAATQLADKMNKDTKIRRYYAELCLMLRSMIKYNIGGWHVLWETDRNLAGVRESGNRHRALDMYNFLWDPAVKHPGMIPFEAEWSATVSIKNRQWLTRRAQAGQFTNLKDLLSYKGDDRKNSDRFKQPKAVRFYKNPPAESGISEDGEDARTVKGQSGTITNWSGWFEGAASPTEISAHVFEIVEMYCWLNPWEFDLVDPVQSGAQEGLQLWQFTMVDGDIIASATPVSSPSDVNPIIPHVVGFFTDDDMKAGQRSMMELLKPFQRFGSFLMNIYVNGARKAIWGIKIVDSSLIDTSPLDKGMVAGVLKGKLNGRPMESAYKADNTNPGVDKAFEMLANTMELVQRFFPNQAQPSQIAGIERAVKSQVSAVMQGANRRMHMQAKLLDAMVMMPSRMICYRNLAEYDSEALTNLKDEEAMAVLGSGLMEIDAERWAQALQEMIYALFQNQEGMASFDMVGLLNHWSRLQNSSTELGEFYRGAPAVPGGEQVPGAEGVIPAPEAVA